MSSPRSSATAGSPSNYTVHLNVDSGILARIRSLQLQSNNTFLDHIPRRPFIDRGIIPTISTCDSSYAKHRAVDCSLSVDGEAEPPESPQAIDSRSTLCGMQSLPCGRRGAAGASQSDPTCECSSHPMRSQKESGQPATQAGVAMNSNRETMFLLEPFLDPLRPATRRRSSLSDCLDPQSPAPRQESSCFATTATLRRFLDDEPSNSAAQYETGCNFESKHNSAILHESESPPQLGSTSRPSPPKNLDVKTLVRRHSLLGTSHEGLAGLGAAAPPQLVREVLDVESETTNAQTSAHAHGPHVDIDTTVVEMLDKLLKSDGEVEVHISDSDPSHEAHRIGMVAASYPISTQSQEAADITVDIQHQTVDLITASREQIAADQSGSNEKNAKRDSFSVEQLPEAQGPPDTTTTIRGSIPLNRVVTASHRRSDPDTYTLRPLHSSTLKRRHWQRHSAPSVDIERSTTELGHYGVNHTSDDFDQRWPTQSTLQATSARPRDQTNSLSLEQRSDASNDIAHSNLNSSKLARLSLKTIPDTDRLQRWRSLQRLADLLPSGNQLHAPRPKVPVKGRATKISHTKFAFPTMRHRKSVSELDSKALSRIDESFTKTLGDLENLMETALNLVNQAAENQAETRQALRQSTAARHSLPGLYVYNTNAKSHKSDPKPHGVKASNGYPSARCTNQSTVDSYPPQQHEGFPEDFHHPLTENPRCYEEPNCGGALPVDFKDFEVGETSSSKVRLNRNQNVAESFEVPEISTRAHAEHQTTHLLPLVNSTFFQRQHVHWGPNDTSRAVIFYPPKIIDSQISLDGPSDSDVIFPAAHQESDVNGTADVHVPVRDINRLQRRHAHRVRRVVDLSLKGRSHVSLKDSHNGFSLSRSHRRQPVARDWSTTRKRVNATIACISTALIGMLIGIYAGEVPSIQYYIADLHHYAILGNVFLFIGLAIPTFFCWPLPLLHGRKPYILVALAVALPLQFPQAIVCSYLRSPSDPQYRVGLLLSRAVMGVALGFASLNMQQILLDLFGASLQSGNPHQEVVDPYDVRRHGGGMGVWLGIWTWCFTGSIGIGFLLGAVIINSLAPSWGFYISIIVTAVILLLNIVAPEVRRSPYRRSISEIRVDSKDVSRRLARGEVMMHRVQTGPKWWGEELYHGVLLSLDMLRQPGFLVLALYMGWIYGQIVLIIVLLGSLTSKYYFFKSPDVGACVMALPIGTLLAVPFQKASLFSRARHHNVQRTNSMTFDKRITWSSHLVRRVIFTVVLPFAGLGYTLSSGGPPTPWILPTLFAALIGFLSGLAIAECSGIIMETFDTSDLQPGMTGRPRASRNSRAPYKRTNYSSFPRVASAFAITQSWGFLMAAAATGCGGVAQRHLGQQTATGVMAAILLALTILLLGALIRWKDVQIIPNSKASQMETWKQKRRESVQRMRENRVIEPGEEADADAWRPVIIGNPSGRTRKMSVLEMGHLSRWSEIRKKNRLIDEAGYEGKHPNLATLGSIRGKLHEKEYHTRGGTKLTFRGKRISSAGQEATKSADEQGESADDRRRSFSWESEDDRQDEDVEKNDEL